MTFTMSDCPSFRNHVHADSVTEDHTLNDIDLLDLFLNHTQPVFIVGDFFFSLHQVTQIKCMYQFP